MCLRTISFLARHVLGFGQPLAVFRIKMTDWLIWRGFKVAEAFQNTNLLQVLRGMVGVIYSIVWTSIHFRACIYRRHATGPYSVKLNVTPMDPTIVSYM